MRIILTHEQADFDALASLLGAHLLDETAIPVLPRRMNRNVRAFLTLYGSDLPFIDPRDLPNEPIEAVTLVDTQSMVSIKGMAKDVRVHVIDHHPLREDISSEWSITVSATGANTTILIEAMRERDFGLSTIHATLLLLGIYEDTGSLTYTRTTARDLRAASYLLEQGASLQIAADFLNHPLSKHQQDLYDELRANTKYFQIHGHTVIVTSGDAEEMDEELSTIAHKLRDLLDPDALFLLVTTRGGVQLIARSTTDNIDVAEVASHFGGGGHDRAAASLIKDRKLGDVREELVELLPNYVRPAVVVSQIMSRGPQMLSPDTPVEEAAQRMQRFGYEGYPVVRNGKLIGLLTRRAVDRALAHKLNLTAASLMEAGDYTVQPDDSIEHLQRLMTETGWGQIPVVHPDTQQIIGIVTRTDLLKTLTPEAKTPSRENIAERLEYVLPPARLALLKVVAQEAFEQRGALYIVGGFVRDLLLERPSLDFDLVVEGDAIALAKALASKYGGRVTGHTRFGTAKWIIKDIRSKLVKRLPGLDGKGEAKPSDLPETLDLVTARTEFYTHPSALPTVERGSIKLDLHRRDFTINTLALRLDGSHYGELHDYWGGLNDLRRGLVRVLHSLSFVDDPTRILRAVRFEQRFGFRIETRTLELLREAASLLGRVSGDRIRHELDSIFAEDQAAQMLARLNSLDLLEAIHSDLKWDEWLNSRIESLSIERLQADYEEWELASGRDANIQTIKRDLIYILWMLRYPFEKAREIIARLKLSSDLAKASQAASQLWRELDYLENKPPSKIVSTLEDMPPLAIYAVYTATDEPGLREILHEYVSHWKSVVPTISGHDLRAMGLRPGPKYRFILEALRDAWLDGKITTPDQEAAYLETLIQDQNIRG